MLSYQIPSYPIWGPVVTSADSIPGLVVRRKKNEMQRLIVHYLTR